MPAFVFNGTGPAPYPWGTVNPGEVAVFMHRPPDGNWSEVPIVPAVDPEPEPVAEEVAAADEAEVAEAEGADEAEELRQPNKAASADDWKAYAAVEGSFQAATGTHPDEATRKAIVDHYTAEGE